MCPDLNVAFEDLGRFNKGYKIGKKLQKVEEAQQRSVLATGLRASATTLETGLGRRMKYGKGKEFLREGFAGALNLKSEALLARRVRAGTLQRLNTEMTQMDRAITYINCLECQKPKTRRP